MKLIVFCLFFLCIAYYYPTRGMVIGGSLDNASEAIDVVDNQLCTPEQWEGFSTSWYPELDTLALANISYDFQNRKFALDVAKIKWEEDGSHECKKYSMIFRFDKKKAYFFHDREDGKNCTVKELEHDFEEWCVPKDAKCMGPFTIGGSLEINAYKFNISGHDDNSGAWVYFESTAKGIPVNAKYGSEHVKGTTDWYDITAGIDDPQRFEPPDFCEDVTPTPWRHGHRGGEKRSPHSFSLWHLPYRV